MYRFEIMGEGCECAGAGEACSNFEMASAIQLTEQGAPVQAPPLALQFRAGAPARRAAACGCQHRDARSRGASLAGGRAAEPSRPARKHLHVGRALRLHRLRQARARQHAAHQIGVGLVPVRRRGRGRGRGVRARGAGTRSGAVSGAGGHGAGVRSAIAAPAPQILPGAPTAAGLGRAAM
ncbi:MAG: hypothetical protein J3K34DRAFT_33132 [Monoraphidium minutum]|nr:MAG: hypothetical protein J3K34DRAFT_33132 [Monoraphidium minutum]